MSSEARPAARSSLAARILRTARLHADTYEEIEADVGSLWQASLVVAVCALSAAIGAGGVRDALAGTAPVLSVPLHVVVAALEPIVLWLVAGALAYMVGATFLRGPETETDYAEVLRTTGFAFGPGILLALAVLPLGGGLGTVTVTLAVRLWILVAWVVAVRQALDYSTARAAGTALCAFTLAWLLLWGLAFSV